MNRCVLVLVLSVACGRDGFLPPTGERSSELTQPDARSPSASGSGSGMGSGNGSGSNDNGNAGGVDPEPPADDPVVSALVGLDFSCALFSLGDVYCWGRNNEGQLGRSDPGQSSVPLRVPLDEPATALGGGTSFACARLASGWQCWGRNGDGQLGTGGPASVAAPLAVTAPSFVSGLAISGGTTHACALGTSEVTCLGNDFFGQLGHGASGSVGSPVEGLTGVTALRSGAWHGCAVAASEVRCWGRNDDGQLGDGTLTERAAPVLVAGLNASAVAGGGQHSCALRVDGTVSCWGDNTQGQLGDGTLAARRTPGDVPGLSDVVAVEVGETGSYAFDGSGTLWCWGFNTRGSCGQGTTVQRVTSPVAIDLEGLVDLALSARSRHMCAWDDDELYCWGDNEFGQVGQPASVGVLTPRQVEFP